MCFVCLFYDNVEESGREVDRCVWGLHCAGVEAVLAVGELDNGLVAVADGVVVVDVEVLEGLHEAALHVACLGCLDCRVDKTLAAAHSVEEELVGREAVVEAVLDKAFSRGVLGVDGEVGESPADEAVGDARATDDLLADAGDHLADVDGGALGAAAGHDEGTVVVVELVEAHLALIVAHLGELACDLVLQGLVQAEAGARDQLPCLGRHDEVVAVAHALLDEPPLLHSQLCRGRHVRNPDREAVVCDPARRQLCQPRHAPPGHHRRVLAHHHVPDAVLVPTERRLVQCPAQQLAILEADN